MNRALTKRFLIQLTGTPKTSVHISVVKLPVTNDAGNLPVINAHLTLKLPVVTSNLSSVYFTGNLRVTYG